MDTLRPVDNQRILQAIEVAAYLATLHDLLVYTAESSFVPAIWQVPGDQNYLVCKEYDINDRLITQFLTAISSSFITREVRYVI